MKATLLLYLKARFNSSPSALRFLFNLYVYLFRPPTGESLVISNVTSSLSVTWIASNYGRDQVSIKYVDINRTFNNYMNGFFDRLLTLGEKVYLLDQVPLE